MHDSKLYQAEVFKIGAVSRLTGLSAHTLRKWETRYAAVVPRRTDHQERIYTHEDIERLTLMKRLVDAGVAPHLWRGAAQARAFFEDAIERVAAAEGISIEE